MTKEELEKEAYEWTKKNISVGISMYNPSIEMYCGKDYKDGAEPREKRITELEAQIEKLINFVLSKTDCCDVCPETDTCINSKGTCPYAGILAKGEEEVTRKWLIRFIKRREK